MLYAILKTLHVLSIIVWVGGMAFAHCFLRPVAAQLDPPVRLNLLCNVLGRFFKALLWVAPLAIITGIWMIGNAARSASQAGIRFSMPLDWHIMSVLGLIMLVIFLAVRFRLYPQFARAVAGADWPVAGAAMAKIRKWVAVNLVLGLTTVVVALVY